MKLLENLPFIQCFFLLFTLANGLDTCDHHYPPDSFSPVIYSCDTLWEKYINTQSQYANCDIYTSKSMHMSCVGCSYCFQTDSPSSLPTIQPSMPTPFPTPILTFTPTETPTIIPTNPPFAKPTMTPTLAPTCKFKKANNATCDSQIVNMTCAEILIGYMPNFCEGCSACQTPTPEPTPVPSPTPTYIDTCSWHDVAGYSCDYFIQVRGFSCDYLMSAGYNCVGCSFCFQSNSPTIEPTTSISPTPAPIDTCEFHDGQGYSCDYYIQIHGYTCVQMISYGYNCVGCSLCFQSNSPTGEPTSIPTGDPTMQPTTLILTASPTTLNPTIQPTTLNPTPTITATPTSRITSIPTTTTTSIPTTTMTSFPTTTETSVPTTIQTSFPTFAPFRIEPMDYEIYNCSIKAMTLCPTNEKHNICIVDAIRLCTPNPKCECKSVIDNLMPLYTTAIIILPIVLVFFFLKSIFERYRLFKEERNLHLGQIGDGKYSTVIEMNNVAI